MQNNHQFQTDEQKKTKNTNNKQHRPQQPTTIKTAAAATTKTSSSGCNVKWKLSQRRRTKNMNGSYLWRSATLSEQTLYHPRFSCRSVATWVFAVGQLTLRFMVSVVAILISKTGSCKDWTENDSMFWKLICVRVFPAVDKGWKAISHFSQDVFKQSTVSHACLLPQAYTASVV